VGIDFCVTIDDSLSGNLESDLRQILNDLDLSSKVTMKAE